MLVNLNEVLTKARDNGYAVGLFNTIDTDMLEAVLSAAEKKRSPVIVGTAEILLPYGELALIMPSFIAAAKRASVPVAVHYDHGLTKERCYEALKLGASSVMFDGSAGDVKKNIEATAEMAMVAHAFGATLEGEIGHVGQAADGDESEADCYTTPDEAVEFVKATGVDALAVAIGTAHGVYRAKPRLDVERLRKIRKATDVPLVLHGGSGLDDDAFRSVIKAGIAKVNIFTDLCVAGMNGIRAAEEGGLSYLETRKLKVEYIEREVAKKIELFGSANRA